VSFKQILRVVIVIISKINEVFFMIWWRIFIFVENNWLCMTQLVEIEV